MLTAFAGGSVFGERWGDGPPAVVWLHGWGRSSADFRPAASALLERGISSIALDLPGFGASPSPSQPTGARGYADLIAPVLEEVAGGREIVLVGHSFGGRIAAVLASEPLSSLRGVVFTGAPLIRPTGVTTKSPLPYRVIRALSKWQLVSSDRLELARKKYGSADYAAATGVMRDVLVRTVNESYEVELQKIRVTTIFVWGGEDRDVPPVIAEHAARLMSARNEIRVERECGHLLPRERPLALVDAVMDLL